MSEITLFDLDSSQELVEELSLKDSKLVWGGYPDEGDTSGGSSGGGETGGSTDEEDTPCVTVDLEKREIRECTDEEKALFD